MAMGIKVLNESGWVQFDENYANLAYIQKGTVTVAGTAGASVTYTGTTPMLAIACSTHFATIRSTSVSGTTWTWLINVSAPYNATVTYYIFDTPPASATTGMAVVVKNASSAVTYDSRNKYLSIATVLSGSNYTAAYPSWTGTSGKTYACMMGKLAGRAYGYTTVIRGTTTYNETVDACMCKIVSNAVTSAQTNLETFSSTSPSFGIFNYTFYDYSWFIIDVTGY